MRRLNADEANRYLASIELKIGRHGQICDAAERPLQASEWINRAAPTGALPLYCFSHQILQWLSGGDWALVQIDDTTNFHPDEDFLISRLLFGPQGHDLLIESRSFLFEFGAFHSLRERWLLGDLVHFLLLFGTHSQIVAARSSQGQHLSVQDGYAYFVSRNASDIARARTLLNRLDELPLEDPPLE